MSQWDVIKPSQPVDPQPTRSFNRGPLRAEIESARNRFQDFLTILTDFQWPTAAPEIAAAVADLEGWPRQAGPLRQGWTRLGLSKSAAAARFEAAHLRLLERLEQTPETLLLEADFHRAAQRTLEHLDRVNRRLAGIK